VLMNRVCGRSFRVILRGRHRGDALPEVLPRRHQSRSFSSSHKHPAARTAHQPNPAKSWNTFSPSSPPRPQQTCKAPTPVSEMRITFARIATGTARTAGSRRGGSRAAASPPSPCRWKGDKGKNVSKKHGSARWHRLLDFVSLFFRATARRVDHTPSQVTSGVADRFAARNADERWPRNLLEGGQNRGDFHLCTAAGGTWNSRKRGHGHKPLQSRPPRRAGATRRTGPITSDKPLGRHLPRDVGTFTPDIKAPRPRRRTQPQRVGATGWTRCPTPSKRQPPGRIAEQAGPGTRARSRV